LFKNLQKSCVGIGGPENYPGMQTDSRGFWGQLTPLFVNILINNIIFLYV